MTNAPERDDEPRGLIVGGLERHIQSILLALVTAGVLYSGTFVVGSREDAVRFSAQIAVLTNEVSALRAQLSTMQSNYINRDEYRDHEARLRSLESTRRDAR